MGGTEVCKVTCCYLGNDISVSWYQKSLHVVTNNVVDLFEEVQYMGCLRLKHKVNEQKLFNEENEWAY
jgi:hypothetical protein